MAKKKRIFNKSIHCGALGRRKNAPCCYTKGFRTNHPGTGKCYLHGGRSTGAKTIEGKQLSAQNSRVHGLYSTVLTGKDLARLGTVQQYSQQQILQNSFELIHAKLLGVIEGDVRLAARYQKLYAIAEMMSEQGEFDWQDLPELKLRLAGMNIEALTRVSASTVPLANAARQLSEEGNLRKQNNLLMNFLGQVLSGSKEIELRQTAIQYVERLKLEAGVPVQEIQAILQLVQATFAIDVDAETELDFE